MTKIEIKKLVPIVVAGLIAAVFIFLPFLTDDQVIMSITTLGGVWAIAAMGFVLILRTGQFSMGQAAFLAIGGYTTSILVTLQGWPFWLGFLMSGIVAGIVALVIGRIVLRVGNIYFSIITLSLGEMIRIIAQAWSPVTKGTRGILNLPPPTISLGAFEINFQSSPAPYYYFIFILVVISGLVCWQIMRGRIGNTFNAMALNETLAEHQGIPLMRYRVLAFTVAGILAGYAGAFYSTFVTVMNPTSFGLWQSIQAMMMGIVGGISSLAVGPVVGALLLYGLSNFLTKIQIYGLSQFLFGAIVVLVILFLPRGTGLIDVWNKLWDRFINSDKPAKSTAN